LARVTVLASVASPLGAQYLGLNLRGDYGMKSGSQPGPGVYINLPLFYRADYDSVRGPQGNPVPGDFNARINLLTPAIIVTTKWKVAGANFGFQVVPIVMNQRLDVASSRVETSNSYGWGDTYVQPVNLGWNTKRADFLTGYGFYAPTGAGKRSLDMWAHEIVTGSTVYLDAAKLWHVAGTMFYEIHQQKRTEEIRPGDFLTIEGGAGRSFLKGAANIGAAYFMQWKTTDDSGSGIPPVLRGAAKNKAYGVGPEIAVPIFAKGPVIGLIGFRYTFEIGNSVNFQGNNLVASFTLARLFERAH
jgi:hypothetical protein